METGILIEVAEESQAGHAKRAAAKLARSLDFDEIAVGRVGLILAEATANILRYGGGGLLILQAYQTPPSRSKGLEILVLDKGPGMRNIAACLTDGYSTGGTPGTGLGAMQRLSNFFDIYSQPGLGTALLCRVNHRAMAVEAAHKGGPALAWGAIAIAYPGEVVSGDGWSAAIQGNRALFLVADGLGHGEGAAEAAGEVVTAFHAAASLPLQGILRHCDGSLRKTRGVAAAIAEIDVENPMLRYIGIGNIFSSVYSPEKHQHLVSHAGIVGHTARKFQEFSYSWGKESLLIMQSDGLSTRNDFSRYQGLAARDPTLIAGVIFRDGRRGRDDATVLVVKARSG